MFWDKKKKSSELPDLPMPPQFPSSSSFNYESPENMGNQENNEINQLPSFPDSPVQKGFSQMAIKDAVGSSYLPDSPKADFLQNQSIESTESSDSELAISKNSNYKISGISSLKSEKKPIFVRLDKFQVARASLEEMKQKIYGIEEALGKIKDIKAREDQELMLWEKEIEMMKARVGAIIKDIFERGE